MIKKILSPGNYPSAIHFVLLILRLSVGIFMLTHGMGKFSKLFGPDPIKFTDPLGIGEPASLALTVFAEVLCSVFLIVGLATRLAALPLAITMLVAVFITHAKDAFGNKELALLYLVIYVCILISGAGKFSIDYLISGKTGKK